LAEPSIACLSCAATNLRPLRRYKVQTHSGRRLFAGSWLHECLACGLVQAVPLPESRSLADYYATAYWESTHAAARLIDARRFPKDNLALYNRGCSMVEFVAPRIRSEPRRILDIGAGYGHVLHAMGQRYPGAARVAIESADSCRRHLESLDIEVVRESVEEFVPHSNRTFDLIVLSHVLEHFADPKGVLALLRSALDPDGVLCLEVPNAVCDSRDRLLFHPWISECDEPHITFYSTLTLSRLVQYAGYEVVACETVGPEYRDAKRHYSKLTSLRSALRRILPPWILTSVRQQRAWIPERDPSFFQYGGTRIWIRCLARPSGQEPVSTPAVIRQVGI
jgi:SAM-dependent methyltransferase